MGYYYDGILNEEFTWDRKSMTNVNPVCGLNRKILVLEVDAAIGKTKQSKSASTTGFVPEMLKATGETGTMWMTDVCNAVVRNSDIPED